MVRHVQRQGVPTVQKDWSEAYARVAGAQKVDLELEFEQISGKPKKTKSRGVQAGSEVRSHVIDMCDLQGS